MIIMRPTGTWLASVIAMKACAIFCTAAFAALSLGASSAAADTAGEAALAAVDTAHHRAATLYVEYRAVTNVGDEEPSELAFAVWTKGDRRLGRVLAPSDVKNIKVLVTSPADVCFFSPALGSVRRIAPALMQRGFLGMTFSAADFALASYSDLYRADIAYQDEERSLLVLTPRDDAAAPYARIEMFVETKRSLPFQMKYFDAGGTHLKTERRMTYSCIKLVCAPEVLLMIDHTRDNATTRLTRRTWIPNPNLPDEMFTARHLAQ
jgi:hypothetical protein